MKSRIWLVSFLVLMVMIASCSGKGESKHEDTAGTPQSEALVTADTEGTPAAITQLLQQIEAIQATLPRDRMDPAAVIAVTREPANIFAWVRENTRAVAYEGSLRGPVGVLMDRRGNSLDRALLVSRLLTLAGYPVRIVGGKLSPADALKASAEASKEAGSAPALGDERKAAAAIATTILAKTGPLTLTVPAAESTHYWAQFNDGKAWIDADTTVSTIGQARTRAEGSPITIDPQTHGVARSDSSHLLHTVTMSFVVERWEAGRLAESSLGEMSFDSSIEPLSAITVAFVPVDQAQNKAVKRAFTTGAELYEHLLGETAWAVVAGGFGSATRMGRMFDDAGIVGDVPKTFDPVGVLGGAAAAGFGDFMDAFGGGAEPEPEQEKPSVLTALIADYEITVPGKPAHRVRRFIFDSIGPEARSASGQTIPRPTWSDQQRVERGAHLAGLHDTLVTFASLSPDVYVYRFAQRVIDSADAVLKVAAGSQDEALFARVSYGLSFRTLELFAALRDSAMDPKLAVAEPQIVRREIRYVPDGVATTLRADVLGDLTWNRLAPTTGSIRPVDLVTQGVLDTLQESAIVLREGPPLPDQTTSALFEEAVRQGIDSVAVRHVSDAVLMSFPGDARARMLRDLQTGQVLVTPRKPVVVDELPRLGWWRVDPNTGQVVGAMDNGLLATLVTYVLPVTGAAGIVIQRFGQVAGPRAVQFAQQAARLRQQAGGSTTQNQYNNLLKYAQEMINAGRGDLLGF